MKPILKIKIAVDAAMSVSMLLLMAYGLVGEAAHEWIGMGMFALSVVHHVLNRRWIQAVPRGALHALAHRADGTGRADFPVHGRLYDQRHCAVPPCVCVSPQARRL